MNKSHLEARIIDKYSVEIINIATVDLNAFETALRTYDETHQNARMIQALKNTLQTRATTKDQHDAIFSLVIQLGGEYLNGYNPDEPYQEEG